MNSETVRHKQAEHWNYSKDQLNFDFRTHSLTLHLSPAGKQRVDRRLDRKPERTDLWTKILEKSQGPGGLSVDEHHSIASLFMVAGTETTVRENFPS